MTSASCLLPLNSIVVLLNIVGADMGLMDKYGWQPDCKPVRLARLPHTRLLTRPVKVFDFRFDGPVDVAPPSLAHLTLQVMN